MIEGHGDDTYRYAGKVRHNFSSNILNGVDHSRLKEYLSSRLDVIVGYPEPAPYSVERMLAARLGVTPENVMVTNGAVDAIYTVANVYAGARSAVLQPTFSEYSDACIAAGHDVMSFNAVNMIPQDADMVWICNPNNPTGDVADSGHLRKVIDSHPNVLFIIDQAYHRYTAEPVLTDSDAVPRSNLILIYSLTKDYSVPGLRLGYAVACREIIERLGRRRIPWSVNALAIEAAHFLLDNDSDYAFDPVPLVLESRRVATGLSVMGIECKPGETNFILCRLPKGSAAQLKEYLVENHGMLIRDASNFAGLTDRHFRIAVQRPVENDLLIKAIGKWMRL